MINKFDLIKNAIDNMVPIHKVLGLKVHQIEAGKLILKLPYSDMVIGDSLTNRWHGGIISLAIDVAGGIAGVTEFTSINDRLTTVDLRVDYLEAPRQEDLLIEGEIIRMGNRILVSKMRAYHENDNKTLVEGKGVYYMKRAAL